MIQLERPTLRRKDMSAVLQTMADEHIGIGENTYSFSLALKEYLGYPKRVIPLRTIVDSLSFALRSLSLPKHANIGVSVLSPLWYVQVIESLGFSFKLLDIDPETLAIDENLLSETADSLAAVLIDEPYGYQAPFSLYESIQVPVIANISQSFGSFRDESPAGKAADIVIMSFEHSDIVSCGGGSALVFCDDKHYTQVEHELSRLYGSIALGDMNAALGIIQLGQIEENIKRRESFYRRFFLSSQRNRHHSYGSVEEEYVHNGYSFILTLESKYEEAEAFAKKHGILTERAFHDVLLETSDDAFTQFPRSAAVAARTMRFPLYPFLTEKEVQQIERVIAYIP